jgi:hypothetical protein
MKRQIQHMIKYKYLPFSYGKKVRNPARVMGINGRYWSVRKG